MLPPRCPRCREKLREGAQPSFAAGAYDDEFLIEDPLGNVILWLRCSFCQQLRPTTRSYRFRHHEPHGPRSEPGRRPSQEQRRTPPPAQDAPGGRTRSEVPWWASVLGISALPAQRAAAVRLVKSRWRAAVRRHHVDRGAIGAVHHEAFLAKRRAYEAAQVELEF